MRTREWYEDYLHEIISMCLPALPKSDIRPSYQKTKLSNPFAVNHMDARDPMKDGVRAATNVTNIVYFWLHFDPLDFLSTEVSDSYDVTSIIPFKLTVSCYGADSLTNAIRLRTYFRTPDVLSKLLNIGWVVSSNSSVTTFTEEFNGEVWERNDLDIGFNAKVDDFIEQGDSVNSLGDGAGYSGDGKLPLSAVGSCKEAE